MKVFTTLDYYLPGVRAGGPPRTLANMVERLDARIDFWIFTRNHDFADSTPYPHIRSNEWNNVGRAKVFYCSADRLSMTTLRRAIAEVQPDAIYLNSFFSSLTRKCLLLRKLRLLPRVPIIIAPRGEFAVKALSLKAPKKRVYRSVVQFARLYSGLVWQASSAAERDDIVRVIGPRSVVYVAANVPALPDPLAMDSRDVTKAPGHVRFIFLSRVSPMKNLEFALEHLMGLKGDIVFDIYGPTETERYWQHCESLMRRLPPNVRAAYREPVSRANVAAVLAQYHFLILPTKGENFGHVIFEALAAACPVIISDRTPWRNLARANAGWDLPLDDTKSWKEILQRCVDMDGEEFAFHSRAAMSKAASVSSDPDVEAQNITLFKTALARA